MSRKQPFIDYVESLGFRGVIPVPTTKEPEIRAFKYESFDSGQVRHTLGKARVFVPDLFVFVLRAGRAVRVDTKRHYLLLGDGKSTVQALIRSVRKKG